MKLDRIFSITPHAKFFLSFGWDVFALFSSILVAYWLRIGIEEWHFAVSEWLVITLNCLFAVSVLTFFGHYQQMVRYLDIRAIYLIFIALSLSAMYLFAARYAFQAFVPTTVPFIYLTLAMFLIIAPRLLIQISVQTQNYKIREKCIIFGASQSGRTLAQTLRTGNDLLPVAFVDDKKLFQGKQVMGLQVYSRYDIPALVTKHGVNKMLLAVNNTSHGRRKELIAELEPFAIELLSIPNIQDILSGKRKIDELREIKIEELLGREPVPPIADLLDINIRRKRVMITGAGGSIGSELCRQIAKSNPESIVLFELSEFNLYQIEAELVKRYPDIKVVPVLASVQDNQILRGAIQAHNIQTIYHAAAYKHVPMVESNPLVGLRNNVFGTANVALAALEFDVEKFVLISTDKAVRPTNVMGATKRFAELIVQGVAGLESKTQFAIVRFGNVLGSSGSVVPLFTKQILAGGPITVTHPDIIRFFMTIPEAAQLVIQAGAMGNNGEVFVLDMGDPVKIVDLAQKMAHLMGHTLKTEAQPDGNIELKFSGLRPGEKLYEELLIDDADTTTKHPRIMGADETKLPFEEVMMLLDELNYELTQHNEVKAKKILVDAPLAYAPATH